MLPALILLGGVAVAYVIMRNKDEAKTFADQAISGAFRGKRELESVAGRLLDQAWPQDGEQGEDATEAVWVNRTGMTIHRITCTFSPQEATSAPENWTHLESLEQAEADYPNATRCRKCFGG
jgi:hypothetical protein